MSELIETTSGEIRARDALLGYWWYEKSEADKVIAGLKADYKEACGRLQTANLIKDEQLTATRHQKYKRCLAMAEVCKHKRWRADVCDEQGYDYARSTNQMNRWLELAEKFKEVK